jgi:acyl transferase domain-containing protein
MPKIRVSMPELQRRALLEVRKQPGCHNVQEIALNRVAKRAENNWSLCVVAARAADANTAARAAVHVQTILRRDYDLLTD